MTASPKPRSSRSTTETTTAKRRRQKQQLAAGETVEVRRKSKIERRRQEVDPTTGKEVIVQEIIPADPALPPFIVKRDAKTGYLLPGYSSNPFGHRVDRMDVNVRELVKQSGEQAVRIVHAMLQNPEATFGPGSWLSPKEQLQLLEMAQYRAFGAPKENMFPDPNQRTKEEQAMLDRQNTVLNKLEEAIQATKDRAPEMRKAKPSST